LLVLLLTIAAIIINNSNVVSDMTNQQIAKTNKWHYQLKNLSYWVCYRRRHIRLL